MHLLKQYLLLKDMEYVHRVCLLITPEVLAVLWNYTMIKTDLFSTCHVIDRPLHFPNQPELTKGKLYIQIYHV